MSEYYFATCKICGNDYDMASVSCNRCNRELLEALRGGYNEEYTLAIIEDHEFVLLDEQDEQDEQSKSESY